MAEADSSPPRESMTFFFEAGGGRIIGHLGQQTSAELPRTDRPPNSKILFLFYFFFWVGAAVSIIGHLGQQTSAESQRADGPPDSKTLLIFF